MINPTQAPPVIVIVAIVAVIATGTGTETGTETKALEVEETQILVGGVGTGIQTGVGAVTGDRAPAHAQGIVSQLARHLESATTQTAAPVVMTLVTTTETHPEPRHRTPAQPIAQRVGRASFVPSPTRRRGQTQQQRVKRT